MSLDAVLLAKPFQLAQHQRVRRLLLGCKVANGYAAKLGEEIRRSRIAPVMVGGGSSENADGIRLHPGHKGVERELLALEFPITLGQIGEAGRSRQHARPAIIQNLPLTPTPIVRGGV